jgi:NAD-dependent deacetylase
MGDEVRRAARLLRRSPWTAVLTGAGASTESGLPDFRSPGGLWTGVDPSRVASLSAFARDPDAFYEFYRSRLGVLGAAAPNAAHRAIARLEALGLVQVVITQNVDGLHQQAGSRAVVEVHGNLREARCAACGGIVPISEMSAQLARATRPRCARCGGLLRPNVVLFEEMLPRDAYDRAEDACRRCAALVVVGSSLEVYPVAALPHLARNRGAPLVIVNKDPTPYDGDAAVVLRGAAGAILPEVVAAVEADLAREGAGAPERRPG